MIRLWNLRSFQTTHKHQSPQLHPGSTQDEEMSGSSCFYSNASYQPLVAFGELTYGIYVTASPYDPAPIGIAFEAGWAFTKDGLPEAAWDLVVRGTIMVNRYTLRRGAFVTLAGGGCEPTVHPVGSEATAFHRNRRIGQSRVGTDRSI
jgi:hypothetical protein